MMHSNPEPTPHRFSVELQPEFDGRLVESELSPVNKAALIAHFGNAAAKLFDDAEAIGFSSDPCLALEEWRTTMVRDVFSNTPSAVDPGAACEGLFKLSQTTPAGLHVPAMQLFEKQQISQLVWRLNRDAYERLTSAVDARAPRLDGSNGFDFKATIQSYALETLALTAPCTGDVSRMISALQSVNTETITEALGCLAKVGYWVNIEKVASNERKFIEQYRLHGFVSELDTFTIGMTQRFETMQPGILQALDHFNTARLRETIASLLTTAELRDIFYCDNLGDPVAFFQAVESAPESGNFPIYQLARDLWPIRSRIENATAEYLRKSLREAYGAWLARDVAYDEDCIALLGRERVARPD